MAYFPGHADFMDIGHQTVRALKYEQAPKAGHEISLQSPAGLLNLNSSQGSIYCNAFRNQHYAWPGLVLEIQI